MRASPPLSSNSFSNYPKNRIFLPEEYTKIYEKHYLENRSGQTKMSFLSQKMEIWLHKCIAKSSDSNKKTLEIGAGTLNQLEYEKTGIYDIVEPFESLYINSPILSKINHIYSSILDIDNKEKYDRITSCACFEHILNLPEVVAKICFLLTTTGVLYISIPNEGRFLWKLGYKFTTGLEFKRKYNLNYEIIMRHEHVNSADEIENILKYFFGKISMKLLGINKTFAFYRFYECKEPYIEKAREYFKSDQGDLS